MIIIITILLTAAAAFTLKVTATAVKIIAGAATAIAAGTTIAAGTSLIEKFTD